MVVVELRVDHAADDLWDGAPERTVELLTLVPFGDVAPLVAVEDEIPDRRATDLRAHPGVVAAEPIRDADARSVFRVRWADGHPTFESLFDAVDGVVLRAVGGVDGWDVSALFPAPETLPAFWEATRRTEFEVTVEAVRPSAFSLETTADGLTEEQRETLRRAADRGYYDVPRTCTVMDLAEEFGISDQAVSERLRRGAKRLIEGGLSE